jgi:hypothetical protein
MSSINGCAFCRANRKPWTDHTVEVCVELSKCVCGYCKETGHTIKKCPKIGLKKQRQEENEKKQQDKKKREEENFPALIKPTGKQETAPKTTWASLVVKSLTKEERELMERQYNEKKQKEEEEKRKAYEERKRRREVAAIRAEQQYIEKMRCEYGIEECGIGEPGDFWYFFVQGRKDDSNMAKILRENKVNQKKFKEYLREKYFVNWLCRSENTIDDCPILGDWRWEEEKMEYEQEKREQEEVEAYLKEQEDLRSYMEDLLNTGKITQAEYDEWKREKELEDDYAFQAEGDMMWYHYEQNQRTYEQEYNAWEKRSEERKEKYGDK